MTASRLKEKTAEVEVPSNWQEVTIFPPELSCLDTRPAPNPDVSPLSDPRSKKRKIKNTREKSLLTFWVFPSLPQPLGNTTMVLALAEQQWQ